MYKRIILQNYNESLGDSTGSLRLPAGGFEVQDQIIIVFFSKLDINLVKGKLDIKLWTHNDEIDDKLFYLFCQTQIEWIL